MNCSIKDVISPCNFLKSYVCDQCASVNYSKAVILSEFTRTMALTFVKSMAILGYKLRNVYALHDGSIQGLCPELPEDADQLQKLYSALPDTITQVLAERSSKWQGPYVFTFDTAHPDVLRVKFNVSQMVKKTIDNSLSAYKDKLQLIRADWFPEDVKFHLYFNYTSSTPIEDDKLLITTFIQIYFMDIFNYPNISFIDVVLDWVNLPELFVEARIPNSTCKPPAPFYGTYCWLDHWTSDGLKRVEYEDLIASASISLHQGSLLISTNMSLQDSYLIITDTLNINNAISGGIIKISNSTIVPSKLFIYDSFLEISSDFTIDAEEIFLNNASLRIILSSEQEQQLENDQRLEITGISTRKLNNYFNQLEIVGNTNFSECELSTQQSFSDNRLIILLEFSDCNSKLYFILTVCGFSMLGLALLITGIIIYKRNQALTRLFKSLKQNWTLSKEFP